MILADCGTVWSKICDTGTGVLDVLSTKDVTVKYPGSFDIGTGHMAKGRSIRYENELIALIRGSMRLVEEGTYSIVDVGGRDIKFCRLKERRPLKLDWNQSCGANTGFTIELLAGYYGLDCNKLPVTGERIPLTCGVFGMEKMFDMIINKVDPAEALARFVHGLAYNVFNFCGRPEKLYLSGGLCENNSFLASLGKYTDVTPLGRDVLLYGLSEEYAGPTGG
ncbi:MAG: hypothetical protein P9M00_13590 [Candidatus Tritonobacter lacicola]|nr:hypothetical protein [Candidatus Tritonobacter lacicola]